MSVFIFPIHFIKFLIHTHLNNVFMGGKKEIYGDF